MHVPLILSYIYFSFRALKLVAQKLFSLHSIYYGSKLLLSFFYVVVHLFHSWQRWLHRKRFLPSMNARPYWVFFVCKKQLSREEIALVTNLRPLMSEQLLKFGYILYCLNGEYIS